MGFFFSALKRQRLISDQSCKWTFSGNTGMSCSAAKSIFIQTLALTLKLIKCRNVFQKIRNSNSRKKLIFLTLFCDKSSDFSRYLLARASELVDFLRNWLSLWFATNFTTSKVSDNYCHKHCKCQSNRLKVKQSAIFWSQSPFRKIFIYFILLSGNLAHCHNFTIRTAKKYYLLAWSLNQLRASKTQQIQWNMCCFYLFG